jgi:hypothetical protein
MSSPTKAPAPAKAACKKGTFSISELSEIIGLWQKAAFSIPEFCEDTGLGRSFVYDEIRKGRLIARKAGGRTIILASERERYLSNLPILASESQEATQ